MHSSDAERQIRFRHVLGAKAGIQDTLSLKTFKLGDREWSKLKGHVESILKTHQTETPHLQSTVQWVEDLPSKLRKYLFDRLLSADRQFVTQQSVDLQESIDEYEAYRQTLDTAAETDAQLLSDVERLKLRCPSDVTRIDEGVLRDLLSEFDYAPNTLARIAKNWSTFFSWLRDKQKSIARNPCDAIDKTIGTRSKDEVLAEWVDQMVDTVRSTEEKYWLRLLQWTGCRLREGLSLRVSDIELDRGRIIFTETKNDRRRVNPIYPAIAPFLPELLHGRGSSERVLSKITEHTCYDWLYELRERLGIPSWQPPFNAFRSTRANQLAGDREITSTQAGLLLGHSATVARRNYLSVEDSLLQRLSS